VFSGADFQKKSAPLFMNLGDRLPAVRISKKHPSRPPWFFRQTTKILNGFFQLP
jgi:hypothetical protein